MTDLISRADAIEAVHEYFRARLAESDGEWNDELQEYVFSKEDKRLLEYNKGVNTALKALPSADAVSRKAKCCPIAETCMSIDCPVSSEYIGRPSADAEWIPCSERLPEEGEKVLASTSNTVFTQVFKGTHGTSDSWWWNNNTIKTIYAWMPLLKPYREDGEV